MKKGGFVKGTILGAVVGAVAGLLLAPKSGKETREDIKRKAQGTYQDVNDQLRRLSEEVSGRVDSLKEAAKDLQGEAKEESQELVRRAEVLKQDLRVSASNLAKTGAQTKDAAMKDVKLLLAEGSDVMKELERVTRRLAGSAKDKLGDIKQGGNER
jgi:gas vesicle protein